MQTSVCLIAHAIAACLNCYHSSADQDRTARLQSILEYSQEVAAVLRAASGR